MYGDLAGKLILESKRATSLNELPLFLRDLVKDIVQEVSDLNHDIELLDGRAEVTGERESNNNTMIRQCQLFTTHLSMRRNKRCLLVYQKLRADRIVDFCWLNIDPLISSEASKIGNAHSQSDKTTSPLSIENLSHAELDYLKQYQELVLDFKSTFPDLDLTSKLEPPREIFIDVRVLRDGGEIQTEYGSFNLIKDSQFFVRKSDVERLIQQGYLQEI